MKDIKSLKKELRKRILQERGQIASDFRDKADQSIQGSVQRMWEYWQTKKILYYVDYRGEVSTKNLIDTGFKAGTIVCVPLTIPKTRSILAYQIKSWHDLQPGNYGIMEPKPKQCPLIDLSDIELVITPGVAFDKDCNRLGYGGGYYDRLVAKLPVDCKRIALAYQLQIVASVPFGIYDVPVDAIVTEKEIIRRKGPK